MGNKNKSKFHVFFSWQSDSPKKTNANAIRKALEDAEKSLSKVYPGLEIVIDEATRDTSGSPNIAIKILKKIERADMLVCDITTINPGAERRCPNPNVTYELGYAMALLGEERIVMLFNQGIGAFPADLPFDFIQNRASPYTMVEPVDDRARVDLTKLVKAAVKAVIDKSPKTPAQLRGLSRETIEHEHDVENMKWLMSKLHLPTIDEHISQLPHCISTKALWFWEDVNGVVDNSRFSLYDKVLNDSVRSFHTAWRTALSYDQHYRDAPGGMLHIFTEAGDSMLSSEKQRAWDKIEAARNEMAEAFRRILERLRADYIEVKVSKLSDRAWKQYVTEMREMHAMISPSKKSSKPSKALKKGK